MHDNKFSPLPASCLNTVTYLLPSKDWIFTVLLAFHTHNAPQGHVYGFVAFIEAVVYIPLIATVDSSRSVFKAELF